MRSVSERWLARARAATVVWLAAAISDSVSPARTVWAPVLSSARKARPTTAMRLLLLDRWARMEDPPGSPPALGCETYWCPSNPSSPNFNNRHKNHSDAAEPPGAARHPEAGAHVTA